jgi:hypothetical protein
MGRWPMRGCALVVLSPSQKSEIRIARASRAKYFEPSEARQTAHLLSLLYGQFLISNFEFFPSPYGTRKIFCVYGSFTSVPGGNPRTST